MSKNVGIAGYVEAFSIDKANCFMNMQS